MFEWRSVGKVFQCEDSLGGKDFSWACNELLWIRLRIARSWCNWSAIKNDGHCNKNGTNASITFNHLTCLFYSHPFRWIVCVKEIQRHQQQQKNVWLIQMWKWICFNLIFASIVRLQWINIAVTQMTWPIDKLLIFIYNGMIKLIVMKQQ